MKSRKSNVQSRKSNRLGLLSVVTMMIVLFSTGVSIAAEEFKLLQRPADSTKWVELNRLTDRESPIAVDLLKTSPSADNFKNFARIFSSEPFKFVEGVKAAMLKVEAADLKKFKDDTLQGLLKVEGFEGLQAFGGSRRKNALIDLLQKLFGMDKAELEKMDKEELLKKLFSQEIREELGLKLPEELEPKPEPTKVASPEPTKAPSPEPTKAAPVPTEDPDKKALQDTLKRMEEEFKAFKDASNKKAPEQPVSRVGEQDDSALRKAISDACNKFDALQKGIGDGIASQLKPFSDALNSLFNQFDQFGRNKQNKDKNKDRLEDLLGQAIADANRRDNNQIQPPPPPVQPPAPRQARKNNNDQLPLPPPEKEQPPSVPFVQPTETKSQIGSSIEIDGLPSPSFGRKSLYDAEAQMAVNANLKKSAMPPSLQGTMQQVLGLVSANPNPQTIAMASQAIGGLVGSQKAKISDAKNRTEAQLAQLNNEINSAEEKLAALKKEGARGRLGEGIIDEQERLKKELSTKEKAYAQQKQALQASGDPEAAQKIGALDADLAKTEAEVARVTKVIDRAVKRGDGAIEAAEKRLEKLTSAKTTLAGDLETLAQKEGELDQVQTTFASQLQAAAAPAQTAGGRTNAAAITGFSGGTGGPRTLPPGRVIPQRGAAAGGVERGMLRSTGAATAK